MTNNTIIHTIDNDTYTITLPDDDRAILRMLLECQRDAAAELLRIASRDLDPTNDYSIDADYPLTQFDYSGDHDDYNPAASNILNNITFALCAHTHDTALELITELMTDPALDFLRDCDLATFDTPLLHAIHNTFYDD